MAPCPLVKMVAHHPPLLVTMKHSLVHDSINSSATFSYDFHKADHRSIAELFTTLDWENVLDLNNIESAAQTFSAILAYAIDRHVPKKSQEHKTGPPWQTTSLRRLKTFKKAALRRFTKHRTVPLRIAYVRLNHKYKYASQRCFSRYQHNIQRNLKSNPKRFWKFVNEQRKVSGLPSAMRFNSIEGTTPREICDMFSEKFASVFSRED